MKDTFMKYKWYYIVSIIIAIAAFVLGICHIIPVELCAIIPMIILMVDGCTLAYLNGKESDKQKPKIPESLENDYFKFTTSIINVFSENDVLPRIINVKNVNVEYSSSNTDVATIDQNGNVKIKDNGITNIIAKFNGNDYYLPKETSYQLIVNIHKTEYLNPDDFKFDEPSIEIKIDENNLTMLNHLINTNNLNVEYSSSNNDIATVDQNGNVKVKNVGTCIITASFKGNNDYYTKDVSYTLSVKPNPINISDDDFKYETNSIDITNENEELPKLINNLNLKDIKLTTSNENVAKIENEILTIVNNGTCVITSYFEGNDKYNYKEASYELNVNIIKNKNEIDALISQFKEYCTIDENTKLYEYLVLAYNEAYSQFYENKSLNDLPLLFIKDNFPNVYDYFGTAGNEENGFKSLVGWMFALIITELIPYKRAKIFKIGYEYGGYTRYSNIFGYKFKADPNIARLVGSTIYASLRGKINPNTDTFRSEIKGYKYSKTLQKLYDDYSRTQVDEKQFFTDFREFMPTAPGPYAPGYTTRPDNTYPNEPKESDKNLKIDLDIHKYIIERYNLDNNEYFNQTVQAIADKEWDAHHLYGDNISYKDYKFHPVFSLDTIGKRLDPEGSYVNLVNLVKDSASTSRGILQGTNSDPKQYGRLRPGCSWEKEAAKHSNTDDRYNVLCNFDIEDNDGCPTGYYNKSGKWVYPEVKSEKDFCEYFKKQLYANSYPSGHSSGIFGAAMVLMELMPDRSDKIMKAANQFAINRTIARFHWTSDTINGRVLGSAQNAVCHAASDWDQLFNNAKKDIS